MMHSVRIATLTATASLLAGDATQFFNLGVDHQRSGRLADARAAYESALKEAPTRIDVLGNLALVYLGLGEHDKSVEAFRKVLKARPELTPARMYLATALFARQQFDHALEEVTVVLKHDPRHGQAQHLAGLIHLKRGEIAAGIGALEHALEANPANPDATLTLASAYVSSREIAKAEALLSRAQLPNSPQQQLVRGALLHARGDYKGAAQAFSESLARRPGLPTAHSQLGLAFMMLGEHSRAAAQFNAELDQNPGDYAANANLGLLYLQDKKYADARALLDKAREVRPGDPGLMYLLAQVRSAEGQHQLAAEALEQVVEGRPGFIPAHVLLARTYARLKRTEDSRRVQATIRRLTDEEQKRNLQGTAVYSGQTSTAEPAHAGAEVTQ